MANVFVTEHFGLEAQERQSIGAPIASYSLSSASTPRQPNASANFIRVVSDTGALISFYSTFVAVAGQLTSTNGIRISSGVFERFHLTAGSTRRIMASST